MKFLDITRNARLKKDDDGLFWLMVESTAGSAVFCSAIETNRITQNKKQIGLDDVLDAFIN